MRLETETERRNRAGASGSTDAVLPVLEREGDDYGQCRVWLLRGQIAWHAGHVGAQTRPGARRPRARRPRRAADASCSRSSAGARRRPCSVRPRSTWRSARCEEFRELVGREPDRDRVDAQPARVAACDEGRVRDGRADCWRRRARSFASSAASAPASRISRRPSGCSRDSRRSPRRRCAADVETLSAMGEGARARDDHRPARRRPSTRRGAWTRPAELCAMTESARRGGGHRDAGDLARRAGEDLSRREGRCEEARRSRATRSRSSSRPTCSHTAVMRCSISPRCCGPAVADEESDRATRAGLALYELKGNAAAAVRARSLLGDRPGGK